MDAPHAVPAHLPPPPAGAIRVGPFLVEPNGGMRVRGDPALRFAWRSRGCEARIADGRIRLTAAVGSIPYTAERRRDRAAALAAIEQLPRELPPDWRLSVKPDHRLLLAAEVPLREPTTAAVLVSALVYFALALDPYLDRLELVGVAA
jgi:hypothetical protein